VIAMDGKMIVLAKKLLPPDDRLGRHWKTQPTCAKIGL